MHVTLIWKKNKACDTSFFAGRKHEHKHKSIKRKDTLTLFNAVLSNNHRDKNKRMYNCKNNGTILFARLCHADSKC